MRRRYHCNVCGWVINTEERIVSGEQKDRPVAASA